MKGRREPGIITLEIRGFGNLWKDFGGILRTSENINIKQFIRQSHNFNFLNIHTKNAQF